MLNFGFAVRRKWLVPIQLIRGMILSSLATLTKTWFTNTGSEQLLDPVLLCWAFIPMFYLRSLVEHFKYHWITISKFIPILYITFFSLKYVAVNCTCIWPVVHSDVCSVFLWMVISKHYFSYILFVTSFQVPVVPLQRPDDMYSSSHSWMQTASSYEDMCSEQGIPTMITWSYDGKEVAVEGSWDNWGTRF